MKKLFTPFLLLALLLVSVQALAGSYDLYVNGIPVTDDNKDNITGSGISGGKISYNPSNKRLIISDGTVIKVSSSSFDGIDNGIEGLSIIFDGNAAIQTEAGSSYAGIFCRKQTYIGSLADRKAPSVSIYSTGNAPAICSYYGADIEIAGLKLVASSANNHAICSRGDGKATLTIHNSKVTAVSHSDSRAGITGFSGGIKLNASVLANGLSVSGGTVVDASGNVVSKVTTYPHVMIGDVFVDVSGVTLTKAKTGATNSASGRAVYSYWDQKLWLENVKLDGASITTYAPDLTVIVSGDCSITSNSTSFLIKGNTSVTGDGALSVISTEQSAVYVDGAYNLSLKIQTFSAGGALNFLGLNASLGTLTVNKYSDDCLYKFAGGKANIYVRNLVMNDMDISTANSYWNPLDRYVYKKDEIARAVELSSGTWFKATSQISYYDLWVAGARVKTNNTQYIHGPRLYNGTVTYDPTAKTLTMDGTTINMTGDSSPEGCAIYSGIQGLTISAIGTNNWTSEAITLNLGGGGTTSIYGGGTLNIISLKNAAINTFGTTNLTLWRGEGTMSARGKTYGFSGQPNSKLSFYKSGSGALYQFAGETANIANTPTLYLAGDVHIASAYQWFDEEHQAVYYKDTKATAAGTSSITCTKIRSDLIMENYPIYIAGTQLYGTSNGAYGNISGFWNKYVKGGNITYDPSSKTLYLEWASIDYTADSDTSDGIIRTTDGTTLTINVYDKCTLEGSTPFAGLYFYNSNVTFTGSSGNGILSVTGGRWDNVYAPYSTVTVKGDVTLEALTRGMGSNLYAEKLIVAENAVVKARQISCLNKLSLLDDRGIIAPARAEFSDTNKRVEVDGMLARDVVIGEYEPYDLAIAGTWVSNANCSDILGDGVFKYNNNKKTLTIDGNYTSYECDTIIYSGIPDLTINVISNSTLAVVNRVSLSESLSKPIIICLEKSTTITGDSLYLQYADLDGGKGTGISFSWFGKGILTFDQAHVITGENFRYGILGNRDSYLCIKQSDLMVKAKGDDSSTGGAFYDWGGIELEDCWIVEPYPYQIFSDGNYSIADGNGNIVGSGSEGTVVITSDRSIYDAIPAVSEATETAPSEVYDLSGRKLSQARSGVNIIRREDGTVVKELRK